MIAHVAEAGEDRGRVVLGLDASLQPSASAIAAAIRVAQAFQSDIESLIVADRQLFELSAFAFAREIRLSGSARALSQEVIDHDLNLAAAAISRQVRRAAAGAGVGARQRVVSDEFVHAVARTCADLGPWNVVALGEPCTAGHAARIRALFDRVVAATGIVVTAHDAARASGPVIVAIEQVEGLPPMLRAAERLAASTRADVRLLLVRTDAGELDWMEDQARLVLGASGRARLEPSVPARDPAEVAERLRRMGGVFLVAQFGGLTVPADRDMRPLLAGLGCPILLVR